MSLDNLFENLESAERKNRLEKFADTERGKVFAALDVADRIYSEEISLRRQELSAAHRRLDAAKLAVAAANREQKAATLSFNRANNKVDREHVNASHKKSLLRRRLIELTPCVTEKIEAWNSELTALKHSKPRYSEVPTGNTFDSGLGVVQEKSAFSNSESLHRRRIALIQARRTAEQIAVEIRDDHELQARLDGLHDQIPEIQVEQVEHRESSLIRALESGETIKARPPLVLPGFLNRPIFRNLLGTTK